MNKFGIKDTFALESRSFFVLAGDITEGKVAVGMHLNLADHDEINLKILGVEFIDRILGKESLVGLCLSLEEVKAKNLENPELWKSNEVVCS